MKKITAFIAMIMLIGALSGCSDIEETSENSIAYVDAGALANESQPEIPSVFFEDPSAKSETSEKSESGNSQANPQGSSQQSAVQVSVSPSKEYSAYIIKSAEFDPEKVKKAVFGDAEITPEIIETSHGVNDFTWEKDGRRLGANSYFISLFSKEMMFAHSMLSTPGSNHDGNLEDFPNRDKNLGFCSRDEAVGAIRKVLDEIGVTVGEPTVYALHQSDLQNEIDRDCAEKGYTYDIDKRWNGEDDCKVSSYTADKKFECYYMEFKQYYNDVPIYDYDFQYMTLKDIVVGSPRITAVYSADGLVGLSIENFRHVISEKEKIDKLITAEAAAKSAAAKYEELADIKRVVFDKLELMYVITPIFNNGKYDHEELIPAWVCTVRTTKGDQTRRDGTFGDIENKETLWIDARTGVEII